MVQGLWLLVYIDSVFVEIVDAIFQKQHWLLQIQSQIKITPVLKEFTKIWLGKPIRTSVITKGMISGYVPELQKYRNHSGEIDMNAVEFQKISRN